jgi:hypothetical protein
MTAWVFYLPVVCAKLAQVRVFYHSQVGVARTVCVAIDGRSFCHMKALMIHSHVVYAQSDRARMLYLSQAEVARAACPLLRL